MSGAPVTIFVPGDASATSLGADATARAIEAEAAKRGREVHIVRNGSRGLFWLEPLVEVVTAAGRVAYGPVSAADVPKLFDAGMLEGAAHALRLGDIGTHPYLASQQRLTGARLGIVDPTSLVDYVAHDGYVGLRNALAMQPLDIVRAITDSGLRGRGGAAFPTGIKWQTVHDQKVEQKYIACNADEGDSGTFSDRMLMEGDPFSLIEGMTIAGIAVGATQGYIYLRVEYPHAARCAGEGAASGARRWLPRAGHSRQRQALRHRGAARCRRVHLRRRDLDAREPGRAPRRSPRASAAAGDQGPVRPADGGEQRGHTGLGAHRAGPRRAVLPGIRHRQVARHHPAAARRQRETRRPGGAGLRAHGERARLRLRRRLGERPSGARRADRRAAGSLSTGIGVRHAPGVRSAGRETGAAGSWRRGGLRRPGRHGAHGALCAGVLRGGILRQVHALPHRLDARRRARGPHHRRPRRLARPERRPRCEPGAARRTVRHPVQRLVVRTRRHDAVPGAQRAQTFSPRTFQRARC